MKETFETFHVYMIRRIAQRIANGFLPDNFDLAYIRDKCTNAEVDFLNSQMCVSEKIINNN